MTCFGGGDRQCIAFCITIDNFGKAEEKLPKSDKDDAPLLVRRLCIVTLLPLRHQSMYPNQISALMLENKIFSQVGTSMQTDRLNHRIWTDGITSVH